MGLLLSSLSAALHCCQRSGKPTTSGYPRSHSSEHPSMWTLLSLHNCPAYRSRLAFGAYRCGETNISRSLLAIAGAYDGECFRAKSPSQRIRDRACRAPGKGSSLPKKMSLSSRMPLGIHSHRTCCFSLNPSSGGRSAQANCKAALLSDPRKIFRCVFGYSMRMQMGTFRGAGETSLEIGLSSTECIESTLHRV